MADEKTASLLEIYKVGRLKILAGPAGLLWLLPRAQMDFDVTARRDTLNWTKGPGLPEGSIAGNQIQSVQRHGQAFVVELKSTGFGVTTLTFEAPSDAEAAEWVEIIGKIKASAAAEPAAARAAGESPAATGTPVRVTYKVGDAPPVTREFALLVIACDPRNLIGICDYSEEELAIFKELVNFTFHTTLTKVKVNPGKPQTHGVIFAPTPLDKLDGSVYAFRNESAKMFGVDVASSMEYNLVTVYQLLGSGQVWTPEHFQEVLEQQLESLEWWPFGEDYEIRTSMTTPYFDHFPAASLRSGRPWDLLDQQGRKNTLLVHASTCFESALHCWGYGELLLDNVASARRALPSDKAAPIAILGAGVSGLLFATRLKGMGYTNLQILEFTDRYGGKTHTVVEDGPYPPNSKKATVCELGTCYLSPAYAPMVKDLQTYLECNQQIDFTQADPAFRGIVTEGQLPKNFDAPFIMNFDDYVILKAVAERGQSNDLLHRFEAKIALALDLAWYGLLHPMYVGWDPPMPATRPESLQGPFGHQTLADFLAAHGLNEMVGALQYGYEVQGYGRLNDIPAYYGLLWITPPITWTILADQLDLENTPVVTAWTKGWGDLWTQIVEKQSLNITYGATTISIVRSESTEIAHTSSAQA